MSKWWLKKKNTDIIFVPTTNIIGDLFIIIIACYVGMLYKRIMYGTANFSQVRQAVQQEVQEVEVVFIKAISLHLWQTHEGIALTRGPGGGASSDILSRTSNIRLGSRVRQSSRTWCDCSRLSPCSGIYNHKLDHKLDCNWTEHLSTWLDVFFLIGLYCSLTGLLCTLLSRS